MFPISFEIRVLERPSHRAQDGSVPCGWGRRFGNGGEIGLHHFRYGDTPALRILLRAGDYTAVDTQSQLRHIRIISKHGYVSGCRARFTHARHADWQETIQDSSPAAHPEIPGPGARRGKPASAKPLGGRAWKAGAGANQQRRPATWRFRRVATKREWCGRRRS